MSIVRFLFSILLSLEVSRLHHLVLDSHVFVGEFQRLPGNAAVRRRCL